MPQHSIPPINTAMIDKVLAHYTRLKDKLGLKIHVHNPEHIKTGQIFLYNHFARFETIVPHIINHQLAGAYTRTIAAHSLFNVNPKLTQFMLDGGAVPNNQAGLLPFLAAEILRGNKVVIFPEGGLVKSRKVMDDDGNFSIWSGKAGAFRKHHKGAAVLALTLDLFKQRILTLFDNDDQERLERWRTELKFNTQEELRAAANTPTHIVPGNITFYPVRISDNFISKTLKRLTKNLPETIIEEAIIEGNILLKNTDMTVRYNTPITMQRRLNWAEQALLNRHFQNNIKNLGELFSIQRSAKTWPEKFLARFMTRETDRLRDQYMQGLYTGITINLSHIASRLILTLYEDGVRKISRTEFSRLLYLSIKRVQSTPDVHTHSSIAWPENYQELLECRTPDLKQFLTTCVNAGLIQKIYGATPCTSKLKFLSKIDATPNKDIIRRNNPIRMHANEAEPITAVTAAIDEAISMNKALPDQQLADYLFDDMLRDFSHQHTLAHNHTNHPKFPCPVPDEKYGEPYFLTPLHTERSKVGIILTHGFLGAPVQLRAFAEHLQRQGHTVLGVRLPGHGTSMYDMQTRSKEDWVASIRNAYKIIAPSCDKIILIGFSTGATVNALFAAEAAKAQKTNPDAYAQLSGLVFASAPIGVQDKNMHILPLIQAINTIGTKLPFFKREPFPFYKYQPGNPHFQYPFMPVSSINELRHAIGAAQKAFSHITLPALVLQGEIDPTVIPSSAQKIHQKLASKDKKLHMLKTDQHNLIGQNIGKTWNLIENFIEKVTP